LGLEIINGMKGKSYTVTKSNEHPHGGHMGIETSLKDKVHTANKGNEKNEIAIFILHNIKLKNLTFQDENH